MKRGILLIALFACTVSTMLAAAKVKVVNLKTEMRVNPVGLDCTNPRFSWEIASEKKGVAQRSYRILVASSKENIDKGIGDMWDSKSVTGDRSNYVAYAGRPLQSGQKYFWKVQVATSAGKAESKPATWQTALMGKGEWRAKWIGRRFPSDNIKGYAKTSSRYLHQGDGSEEKGDGKTKVRARYLRKDFKVRGDVARATLYICGLGLYEAYINGEKLSGQVLSPTPTDYNISVRYNTLDVTFAVLKGENAIGVILGNGRYTTMRDGQVKHYGLPQLLAQLEITLTDGTKQIVCSDTDWTITDNGPIGNNNEYDGEEYDARKEMTGWSRAGYDDSSWKRAEEVAAPKGELLAQHNPNIKVQERIKPVSITEQQPGVYILDMGQNMVGWLKARVNAAKGDTLRMHFVETLQPDGSIYTANLRSAECTDVYVSDDHPDTWRPTFVYHGFRYVELRGFKSKPSLDDFVGEVVYDEMQTIGSFTSSSDILNRIHKNAFWGIRGNYRGMPTDCPQRDERMGWLGDRATGALGECLLFDNHLLYAKWLRDIRETQRPEGDISDVAPIYWSVYNDDVTWPAAWFTIAEMLYDTYGDIQPIRENYDAMVRWMDHKASTKMNNYIVEHDTYGDWCMPPESQELIHSQDPARITDGWLLSTTYYYQLTKIMQKFAHLLGNLQDEAKWSELGTNVKNALMAKFYDKDKGYFCNNTVTGNILPLQFGVIDDEAIRTKVIANIVKKTEVDFGGHVSTGVLGIQQLMRGLTDYGRGDIALKIATNTSYPSWGYMAKNGATTIWELWNGDTANPAMNSGNHVMLLGDLLIWCQQYLAGIGQTANSVAYKRIELRPRLIDGLDSASATYRSIYGEIASTWKKADGKVQWKFTIPCNTTAEVWVPADVKKLKGGKMLRSEDGCNVFEFGSGHYDLEYNL